MAVLISLNDNPAGDGFLLAPLDSTYDAQIKLKTDAATATVTIQAAAPNPAGLVFSTMGPITISPVETTLTVHATVQSASRGDTVIQVLDGGMVVASFSVTCIKHPIINFNGRFEARFATDSGYYNTNPQYGSNVADNPVPLNGSKGWTWALEGEPPFVPAVGNIPANLEDTGVGRAIRLNNPLSLRSIAPPVISTVKSVSGQVSIGNAVETFTTGDAIIGQPVNFGADTYFAGNNAINPGDPAPEEFFGAAREPLALFEINIGNTTSLYFKGASNVGPVGSGAGSGLNNKRRSPDSRPYSQPPYLAQATVAEMGVFSLPDLKTFTNNRIDALLAAYIALPAGPSPDRRSLVRRIGHLIGYLYLQDPSDPKISDTQSQAVAPDVFTRRIGTLAQAFGPLPDWDFKEFYKGKVDTRLHALPGGSSMIEFLRQFFSFDIEWRAFAFHSDELCGHHIGKLSGDETMTGNHIGDPHVHTVDGTNYDFQSVGEFTLLKDGDQMEVQVRHTPVGTANPVTDAHSGLTACVSLTTAVAAKVGFHRVAYQPAFEKERGRARLQFFLDGKPAQLTTEGIHLNGNTVSAFDANGQVGMRIDYNNKSAVTVTPLFWDNHNVWYMNVSVSNTPANEGIMGHIPGKSWLPRLRNGLDPGPRPASLADRYNMLYKTFADSWRITDKTSLFVYAPGTSTETFTDLEWPAQQAPCNVKPSLQIEGAVLLQGMPVEKAEIACKLVTMDDLHKNCVFDVATTGDETFAKGYIFEQELRLAGTSVHLTHTNLPNNPDRLPNKPVDPKHPSGGILVVATVTAVTPGSPTPKGTVVFYANDKAVSSPVSVDAFGDARWKVSGLNKGNHSIKAIFTPEDKKVNHGSVSTGLIITVTAPDHPAGDGVKTGSGIPGRWCFWILLLLILLIIVWFLIKK